MGLVGRVITGIEQLMKHALLSMSLLTGTWWILQQDADGSATVGIEW
jgi:hypothetical protein